MRMKSVRTIQLGDLPKVSEVVIGPFVEHVRECDRAEFRMYTGADARGSGKACQQGESRKARAREMRQILARRSPRILAARTGASQIVFQERRGILGDHSQGALGIDLFERREMCEYLGNRPAVRRRPPVQQFSRQISKQRFEKMWRLFQKRDGGLDIGGRGGLHGAPPMMQKPYYSQESAKRRSGA